MTVRTTLASALLLSAAFVLPAAASPPGASGTTAAGAATPATATTPAPVPGDQAEPAVPQTTVPAAETPPTDVSASGGTATPAQPTTADTGATTTTTAAAPAPTTTAAAPAQPTAAVQAEVGAKVIGAQGVTLGTVAGTDAEGGIQVATKNGTTTLAPGLVGMSGGELTAPTVSKEDIRQTLADEQRSGRTIRSRAVTGSGERVQTSAPMEETPQAAPADQPEPPVGVGETPAEQPAQPKPAETPQPANQ